MSKGDHLWMCGVLGDLMGIGRSMGGSEWMAPVQPGGSMISRNRIKSEACALA